MLKYGWRIWTLTLGISLFFPLSSQPLQNLNEDEKKLFQALITTYRLIRESSIHTNHTNPQELIFSAINGMVESLEDPYSVLLEGVALDQFMKNIDDHYSGIGIYIATNERGILIVDVIPESPAATIGLHSQDIIVKVNGVDLVGKNLDQVKALIQGPEDSLVEIAVQRREKILMFNVVRKNIQVKTVKTEILPFDKTIAYVRVHTFAQNTIEEFQKALNWSKSQKATGMVIDLRNNPGGLLPVVIEMVDAFIDKGTVVSTRSVNRNQELVMADPQVQLPTFLPVVVLMNRYSASASEIFAGALKDHRRAVIVGENSFGKFSVQKLFPIWQKQEEHAVLKLTIARYFLPSGDSFDKIGISPHITVTNESYTNVSPAQSEGENKDMAIETAVSILSDLNRYRQILGL